MVKQRGKEVVYSDTAPKTRFKFKCGLLLIESIEKKIS